MITTMSGLVFPSVSYARKIQYYNNPDVLAYSQELSAERRSSPYQIAMHQHIAQTGQLGRNFVASALDIATWYTPPKGTNVNTYA